METSTNKSKIDKLEKKISEIKSNKTEKYIKTKNGYMVIEKLID